MIFLQFLSGKLRVWAKLLFVSWIPDVPGLLLQLAISSGNYVYS